MAKRKRLSPAPAFGSSAPEPSPGPLARSRAPIADVAGDAAAQSAFEEVAGELHSARQEGRLVMRLPLDAVVPDHLLRDRVVVDEEDMATLRDSLRARGQQTPIEVVARADGRYGLISGWRRLMALQALHQDVPDDVRFATVQALVRTPDSASDAYCAMVEENEIRADLSFYERARIAVKAADQGVYASPKDAIQSLFAAARPAKRSKITAFTLLVQALDEHLRFPGAIPEKLGLRLVQALREDAGFRRRVTEALRKSTARATVQSERQVLERALAKGKAPDAQPSETVAPGVVLTVKAGRVALSGAGVDEPLIKALKQWLRANA